MQESVPFEESEDAPEKLADTLLSADFISGIDSNIVVSDIQPTMRLFRRDLQLLEPFGHTFATKNDLGLAVPISFSSLVVDKLELRSLLWPRRLTRIRQIILIERFEEAFSNLEARNQRLIRITLDAAHELVRSELVSFLRFRHESSNHIARNGLPNNRWEAVSTAITEGGDEISTPGCNFRAETYSSGLTVHWSPAFYIAPNFFGAPSTPVHKILQAGKYTFGVSDREPDVLWDANAIVTVPDDSSVYLNY